MSHTPPPTPDSSLFSSSSSPPLVPPTPDSSLFSSSSSPPLAPIPLAPIPLVPVPPTPDSSLFSSSSSSMIELKMPEILATKLNYTERVAKKMEKMFQNHANVQPFASCFVLETIFFLYLFKKYKMNCVVKDVNAYKTSIGLIMQYDESEEDIHTDRFKRAIYPVARQMFQCIIRGDPIIILPFTFIIKYAKNTKKSTEGHANLLIYRRNAGHIEHFEPHGAEFGGERFVFQSINYTLDLLLELLNGYIDSDNAKNAYHMQHLKLIKASHVCTGDGVQKIEGLSTMPKNVLIEPDGYCSAWTMFFTELCLKNPEIPSRQINDAIMNKAHLYQERDYLRNVIRGYTYFINNKIATHFSYIFDEPVTTAKIHLFSDPTHPKVEIIAFMQKLSEIMNEETGKNKSVRTAIKDRYAEFALRIQSETSSSSSLGDRVSPPRKSPLSPPRKSPLSPPHGLGIKQKTAYKRAHKRALNKKRLSRKRINTPKKH